MAKSLISQEYMKVSIHESIIITYGITAFPFFLSVIVRICYKSKQKLVS